MVSLTVNTGKVYDIVVENGFGGLPKALVGVFGKSRSVYIITDENVMPLYCDALVNAIKPFCEHVYMLAVPPGESSKSLDTLSLVYSFLLENGADRGSVLIVLGGGVIGDLTGFAAATYMRGVPCVQVPTTMLSMVDSSVGGKTAVDFSGYKNIIGAFYQPTLVYINTTTLETLPEREFSGGMAEVIKYGLIMDSDFYRFIGENAGNMRSPDVLGYVVQKCAKLKAMVVEKDERDEGIREILNFGHTFGHAVEALAGLNHGECVALGMKAALELSRMRGGITQAEADGFAKLLSAFSLPVRVDLHATALYDAMKKDKKLKSGEITYIILDRLGLARGIRDVSRDEALTALSVISKGE